MKQYCVKQFFEDGRLPRIVQKGLSLEEAQTYCADDQSSSMTADKPRGCAGDQKQIERWHEKQKHWFYGYEGVEV